MTLSEILEYFPNAQRHGQQYMALCPAHGDRNPSLAISEGERGKILVHCHAGCPTDNVLLAVGLSETDLFPSRMEVVDSLQVVKFPPDLSSKAKRFSKKLTADSMGMLQLDRSLEQEVIQRYELGEDEEGAITIPIYEGGTVVDIRHWLPVSLRGKGNRPKIRSHMSGSGGSRLFPEDQLAHNELVFCEGELDALCLISNGIPAFTLTSGATTGLTAEQAALLKGKRITLCMDNDEAGRQGGIKRSIALKRESTARLSEWPNDRPVGWDVTDEIAKNGVASLRGIIVGAQRSKGVVSLADVQSTNVDWLWTRRIPIGYITMMDGDPGEGKSFATLALAAALTRGDQLPCCSLEQTPSNVLLLSQEDDIRAVIKPRLESLDADMSRIRAFTEPLQFDLDGLERLRSEVMDFKPRMIVVDPIQAHLPRNVDMHKASDVRSVMGELSYLARDGRCAIVAVRHLKKGATDKVLHRGMGSIDFAASARSVLLVGHQSTNERNKAIIHIKSNLSALASSVGFEMTEGRLHWKGISTLTQDDLVAPDKGMGGKLAAAIAFLREELAEGAVSVSEVADRAKEKGISDSTLQRAREELGVESRKTSLQGRWEWYIAA